MAVVQRKDNSFLQPSKSKSAQSAKAHVDLSYPTSEIYLLSFQSQQVLGSNRLTVNVETNS